MLSTRLPGLITALAILLTALPAAAGLLDGQRDNEFLEVDQAFQPSASLEDDQLVVRIAVAPEHYLYRHALDFALPDGSKASLGEPALPDGEKATDDYFGEIETYRGLFTVSLPLGDGPPPESIRVRYQGCADAGLCYPPQERLLSTTGDPVANTEAGNGGGGGFESEQDRLAGQLAEGSRAWAMLSFLGLGLLLALTPCVLPMIPILSGLIVGARANSARAFLLSSVYVLAMALAYTVFGVLAGLFGANLQAALQSPWTLLPFAAIFFALGLAMFGLFELAMPAAVQQRLNTLGQGRSGVLGAALLGFTSALIVGPCLAPPLAGALLYIGSTGDAVLGGAALFALGLGMGLPLILLSTFGAQLLPRAGNWMRQVNVFFGVVLIAVGIWLLQRVLPVPLQLALWAALAGGYAVYLLRRQSLPARLLGGLTGLYALLLLAGMVLGGRGPLDPLPQELLAGQASREATTPAFRRVDGLPALQAAIDQAAASGRAVALDFYADWCVECVHMEHNLFQEPDVRAALQQVTALQVDVTAYDADDRALMREFGVIGPPTVLFFSPQGDELRPLRLIGSPDADAFIELLEQAQAS